MAVFICFEKLYRISAFLSPSHIAKSLYMLAQHGDVKMERCHLVHTSGTLTPPDAHCQFSPTGCCDDGGLYQVQQRVRVGAPARASWAVCNKMWSALQATWQREGQPAPVWVSAVIRHWGETCQGSLPPLRSCYWLSLWGLCSPGQGGIRAEPHPKGTGHKYGKFNPLCVPNYYYSLRNKTRRHLCSGQGHTASWGPRDSGIR